MTTTSRRKFLETTGALFAAPALLLGTKVHAEGQLGEESRAGLVECREWTDIGFIWDIPDIRFPVENFQDYEKNRSVWEQAFNFPAGRLKCGYARLDNYYRSMPSAGIVADFIDRREEFDEWIKWAADHGIHEIESKAYVCDKNPMVISPCEHRFFRIEPADYYVNVTTSRPMTTTSLVQLLNLGYWLPRREFGIHMSNPYVSHKEYLAEEFYFAMRVPAHQMRAWIAETSNADIAINVILGRWEHEGLEPVPVPPSRATADLD